MIGKSILIGAAAALLVSTQAHAASALNPSARFPSWDAYCANVRNIAANLFANVERTAAVRHTTFDDVIGHIGINNALSNGIENVDPIDFIGMLVYLSTWDVTANQTAAITNAHRVPFDASEEKQKSMYSQTIYEGCVNDTLRLAAQSRGTRNPTPPFAQH